MQKGLLHIFESHKAIEKLKEALSTERVIHVLGGIGSTIQVLVASLQKQINCKHLFIVNDKEEAAYFFNDLENLLGKEKVLFYPASYNNPYQGDGETKNANIIQRAEVLSEISTRGNKLIVSYPEALSEKVITQKTLNNNSFTLHTDESVSMDFIIELLFEYEFSREQFVIEPGQFAVRGGIIDLWSFSNDRPYRIEFFGDEVESIRSFDPADQLSINKYAKLMITPNVQETLQETEQTSFIEFLGADAIVWCKNIQFLLDKLDKHFQVASNKWEDIKENTVQLEPKKKYCDSSSILNRLNKHKIVEFGSTMYFKAEYSIKLNASPQPNFNKNFGLLIDDLTKYQNQGYKICITAENPKQITRIETILEDFEDKGKRTGQALDIAPSFVGLHEGFIDHDTKTVIYTDHQIFDRYHRFRLKDSFQKSKQAITIKELTGLKKGDYVTHIDYGIGIFDGLETIETNGKLKEAIRLRYKDNDVLYVNIQSLHRISKYSGKESKEPKINKLGTGTWKAKKAATKKKIKEIAYDLIQLYAKRKTAKGFSFSADNYLQNELEASFMYEDTPDQEKSTIAVKEDMEKPSPMDRLICGDVGFGKTEIAMRAAFKAAIDGKQTAILVPTTVLAFQHYKSFIERFKDFPVTVDYLNRFRTTKQVKDTLKRLEEGKVDIIIGTHRLVSKDIKYFDLGLLIIDEEQKFGVSVKDKLKTLKANLDTLTLTATPIPRTLQFSLLGSRDLSVINTPPPNRQPVDTHITGFNEEVIRDGIVYELSRGGQVYFVHNKVKNIKEVAGMIQRLIPDAKVGIGHGQMEGNKLEKVMMDFMNGDFDVLVATTIIESGLDISNANTIFINQAQNFGLSDLHQMRGRVGRSNKKAFCYLLTPPESMLTSEARRRLKSLEEFSDLGSGFSIAMRDLDIRGAGDLLGAEQSGFMAEIGYETYQKILDEAIQELKESEFKDLYKEELEQENRVFVRDCQIESDIEILIPTTYVNSVDERLRLYKELDSIKEHDKLVQFGNELIDRFGALPDSVKELLNALKLRWLAIEIGFEKLRLKNGVFRAYFVTNPQSSYYQSDRFSNILLFVQQNLDACKMKEIKGKLTLSFPNIDSIRGAYSVLTALSERTKERTNNIKV
ncbi:MAG: transcription-repair coupling factor (superfamily II helicase) [Saprospiraceae bacterium]|jgi:transcription-repair coupling factor (superfamily II helicase)